LQTPSVSFRELYRISAVTYYANASCCYILLSAAYDPFANVAGKAEPCSTHWHCYIFACLPYHQGFYRMTLRPSFLALLFILGGIGAVSADDWHDHDWHDGDWGEHDWHHWHEHWGGPGYGYPYGAPPPVVYAPPTGLCAAAADRLSSARLLLPATLR
jgi:hypothetical protein